MAERLNREQLIALVTRIIDADGTEEEINDMITLLERNVPHPEVSDLIFYSEEDMTAEQMVDSALAYKPMRLG